MEEHRIKQATRLARKEAIDEVLKLIDFAAWNNVSELRERVEKLKEQNAAG